MLLAALPLARKACDVILGRGEALSQTNGGETRLSEFGLYLMSAKGLVVLEQLLTDLEPGSVAFVVTARDRALQKDYYDEIHNLAISAGVQVYERESAPTKLPYVSHVLAVSWRWLIHSGAESELIVFHDSLLPRYRGFAPLISALENGDTTLGVTALLAMDEYDTGPVVAQETAEVCYPLKIADAIDAIAPCYAKLASRLVAKIAKGPLSSKAQDETMATYSMWRDEKDYEIDWTWDAARIRRFVDAVGYPYGGARTYNETLALRVLSCSDLPSKPIENPTPGKVIFVRRGEPVVVCGSGLLQIHEASIEESGESALPLTRFRTRFGSLGRISGN